jgi:tRNA modification GTPase
VQGSGPPHAAISERHRHLLISALKDVVEAGLLLARPTPEPALAASRLRGALETLGEVTGRTYHEELLNTIFSRFCIGK